MPGLDVRELLALSMEADELDNATEQSHLEEIEVYHFVSSLTKATIDILTQRREMIEEYFTLAITQDGLLTSLPLLLKDYTPHYGKLPSFLRRLGRNVSLNSTK